MPVTLPLLRRFATFISDAYVGTTDKLLKLSKPQLSIITEITITDPHTKSDWMDEQNQDTKNYEALFQLIEESSKIQSMSIERSCPLLIGKNLSLFCDAIKQNRSLKSLVLNGSWLNIEQTNNIINALQVNQNLMGFKFRHDLFGVALSKPTVHSIADLVQANNKLAHIVFPDNKIENPHQQIILQSYKHKSDNKPNLSIGSFCIKPNVESHEAIKEEVKKPAGSSLKSK